MVLNHSLRRRNKRQRNQTSYHSLSALAGWLQVRAHISPMRVRLDVALDMGGAAAPVKAEDSAAALVKLAKRITKEQAGKFLHRDGTFAGY